MIPAAVQATQAVADTINGYAPPPYTVSPVGTGFTVYRGARSIPLATLSYTGPDSVPGIVAALWRMASSGAGVTNVSNVANITNLNTEAVEQAKVRGDALEILGWNPAAGLEPTSWVRSYINIEQIKLRETREEAAVQRAKADELDAKANLLERALKLLGWPGVVDPGEWASSYINRRQLNLSEARDEIGKARRETEKYKSALQVLAYHPEMDMTEWAAARRKDLDSLAAKQTWIDTVLCEAAAACRDIGFDPTPTTPAQIGVVMRTLETRRADARQEANTWRLAHELKSARAEMEGLPGDAESRKAWRAAIDKLRALIGGTGPATDAIDRAADAIAGLRVKLNQRIGEVGRIHDALGVSLRDGFEVLLTGAEGLRAFRRGVMEALGLHSASNDVLLLDVGRIRDGAEQVTEVRARLLEALGLGAMGTDRTTVDLLRELIESRDAARAYATDGGAWKQFVCDIVTLTGARHMTTHAGVMLDAIKRWHADYHKPAASPRDLAVAYIERWKAICAVLGIPADKNPPVDLAGFIDPAGPGALMQDFARIEWKGLSLSDVLHKVMNRAAPTTTLSKTRWQEFQDAACALGLMAHVGPGGEVVVRSPSSYYRNKPRTTQPESVPADYLQKAIDFIERHDGWTLRPGQDLHGWIVRARDMLVGIDSAVGKDSAVAMVMVAFNGEEWQQTPDAPPAIPETPALRWVAADLAARWPQAKAIVVLDPHTLVDGSVMGLSAGMTISNAHGRTYSPLQESADVLVQVQKDGSLMVHRDRHGSAGVLRWTGVTWMSKKGRAKTCRIEGLHVAATLPQLGDAEGKAPGDVTVIKVPAGAALPEKLRGRIYRGGDGLAFHVGSGRVVRGAVARIDHIEGALLLFVPA